MLKLTFALFACLAATLAYPYAPHNSVVIENEGKYYLVPIYDPDSHRRNRRETDYGYGTDGAYVKHTETLINNDNTKLEATAFAERHLHPKGPLTTGYSVEYTDKPSDSTVNVETQNTRGQGTVLTAKGRYNIYRTHDGRTQIGLCGQFNHDTGPFAHSSQWMAEVCGRHNF